MSNLKNSENENFVDLVLKETEKFQKATGAEGLGVTLLKDGVITANWRGKEDCSLLDGLGCCAQLLAFLVENSEMGRKMITGSSDEAEFIFTFLAYYKAARGFIQDKKFFAGEEM